MDNWESMVDYDGTQQVRYPSIQQLNEWLEIYLFGRLFIGHLPCWTGSPAGPRPDPDRDPNSPNTCIMAVFWLSDDEKQLFQSECPPGEAIERYAHPARELGASWAGAGIVVEEMERLGYWLLLANRRDPHGFMPFVEGVCGHWKASFLVESSDDQWMNRTPHGYGKTAPEAIARAAHQVIGEQLGIVEPLPPQPPPRVDLSLEADVLEVRLRDIEAAVAKTTPGVWFCQVGEKVFDIDNPDRSQQYAYLITPDMIDTGEHDVCRREDIEFCCRARQDILDLLRVVRRMLRAKLATQD